MKALLIGKEPPVCFGCAYVTEGAYDMVVIGSLTLGQLLRFQEERVLSALAEGKQVLLYEGGLPQSPKNRALSAALASAKRELKSWGVQFSNGSQKKLITAQDAQKLKDSGHSPASDAVLTPLAREILYGGQ